MRKVLIAMALMMTSACSWLPNGVASSPAEIADQTVVDEKIATGAEVLYTTASTLGNTLSRNGLIDRAQFQVLDERAYQALVAVRAAYKTGNSADFLTAYSNLTVAVAAIRDLKEK